MDRLGDPAAHPHSIAIFFIVFLIGLTLLQSYGFLEKTQTILVGALLFVMVIVTFAAQPDWPAALHGAVVPSFPKFPGWVKLSNAFEDRTMIVELVAYMGVMGGGV